MTGAGFLAAVWEAFKRGCAWLAARPMVAGALALGAAFLSLLVKLRITQWSRDKAIVRAETAEVDGQADVSRARVEHNKEVIASAEQTEAQAEGEQAAAKAESDSEVERRRKIAERWEKK